MDLFNLFAKLVLDATEYERGIQEAQQSSQELSSSLDDTAGSFDSLVDAMMDSGGVASENLDALAELDAEYTKSQQEIQQLEQALAELDDGTGEMTGAAQELSDMLDQERQHAAELQQRMQELIGSTQEQTEATREQSDAAGDNASALDKVKSAMSKVKSAASVMIAIKVAKWFWDITAAAAEFGDHIDKTSQKMGMSSKAYQEWSFIAERSGTSIDSLKMSMRTLATQAEANSTAFQKLGISLTDVKNMSQEELFAAVVKGLQDMESGTERTAVATQLLGRGAQELGALLNGTSADIDEMTEKVNSLGGVMSEQGVAQSAAYADAVTNLSTAWQGFKNAIGEAFMGFNTALLNDLANIIGKINEKLGEGKPKTFAEELDMIKQRLPEARRELENFGEVTEANQLKYLALVNEVRNLTAREAELEAQLGSTSEAFDPHEQALQDLAGVYAATFEQINGSLAGWFGTFDEAVLNVTTSADQMIANLESQATFWENYSANLQTLAEAGYGELAERLADMGQEGAEYAQVLADLEREGGDSSEKLAEVNEKLGAVDDAREKAAEKTTELKFDDNSDEVLEHIQQIADGLANIPNKDIYVYTHYVDVYESGSDGSHAGGLAYVPYHNYHALLHEGERVLTKEENQRYNDRAKPSSQPIVLNANFEVDMDGAVLARKMYKYNLAEQDNHGASLVKA